MRPSAATSVRARRSRYSKRDEGEEVEVGELAFEHEVDAEDAGGDDVHARGLIHLGAEAKR